jgi:hypothetical protein
MTGKKGSNGSMLYFNVELQYRSYNPQVEGTVKQTLWYNVAHLIYSTVLVRSTSNLFNAGTLSTRL